MNDIRHEIVVLLPRLRGFARALAGSPDIADDLVQATCEKALRNLDRWTPGTRLDSWMFRIMQNHWIDTQRARRDHVALDDPDAGPEPAGEDGVRAMGARIALAETMRGIARLPEEQRAVLVLVCVEDMNYREAADVLGVPVGTVMSRLARARRALAADAEAGGRSKGYGHGR